MIEMIEIQDAFDVLDNIRPLWVKPMENSVEIAQIS
jgi:hypothetical protein